MFTYSTHPHIFDAIFTHCSWGTLTRLRLVSRLIKAAVDHIQCAHLVLTRSHTQKSVLVHAYPGPNDMSPWENNMVRVPALKPISPLSWSQLPPHPSLELVSATRTLDVCGFVPPSCDLTLLAPAFANLDTLRMIPIEGGGYTPYFPCPARTLVLFTTEEAETPDPDMYDNYDFDDFDDYDDEEPQLCPPKASARIPNKCTKIIINMKGSDIPIADMYHGVVDLPASVTDVTIVIPLFKRLLPGGHVGRIAERILIMDTIELIMGREPCTQYTVVGLESVRPGYTAVFKQRMWAWCQQHMDFNDEKSEDEDTIEKLKRLQGLDVPIKPARRDKIDKLLSMASLLTRDAYVAKVGWEQFALETYEEL